MSSLPYVITTETKRLPVDQLDMGLDLLRVIHGALQDHTFIDKDLLSSLSGTMFTVFDILDPVYTVLNKARLEEPQTNSRTKFVQAVHDYRAGERAFSKWEERNFPDEDTAVEETYGPPMRVLENWSEPFESLEEVREAVRLAFTEDALIDDIAKGPLRAALIYLEKITGWKDPEGGTK